MQKLTLGLRLDEIGGNVVMVELICGEEVSCDAYVSCDDGTVWLTDDDGNYLVDEDGNYLTV